MRGKRALRWWLVSAVLAAGLCTDGCAGFTPSADMDLYREMAQDKKEMARAEVLAPEDYTKSQTYYVRARRACGGEDRAECDKYAWLAKKHLARAMAQAQWLDPDISSPDTIPAAADVEELKDRRYALMERILILEQLRAEATTEEHRTVIDGVLARHRRGVARLDAAVQAKRVVARQEQLQQQQELRRQKQEAEARRERNKQALFDAAVGILGSRAVRMGYGGVVITIRNLFAPGMKTLDATRAARLKEVVPLARDYPGSRIFVEGHTDAAGSDLDNDLLSLARARAVKDYMVDSGIAEERITAIGHGETRPVASNATPQGRAINRRIAVVFQF